MTTVTVQGSQDFSGQNLTNIDRLDFSVGSFTVVTFSANQFANAVAVDGVTGDGIERIVNIVINLSNSTHVFACQLDISGLAAPAERFRSDLHRRIERQRRRYRHGIRRHDVR